MLERERPQQTVLVAFDGVICPHYRPPYTHVLADWRPDLPHPDAIPWLQSLIDDPRLNPVIMTSRAQTDQGIRVIRSWLKRHGLIGDIEITAIQPPYAYRVDDRCFLFHGKFPSIDSIVEFQRYRLNLRASAEGEHVSIDFANDEGNALIPLAVAERFYDEFGKALVSARDQKYRNGIKKSSGPATKPDTDQ